MAVLWETDDGYFGHQIATNSKGELVLELKGSEGTVAAYPKEKLTEVTPYTVSTSSGYDWIVNPELGLVVGDALIDLRGNIHVVLDIDTKCRNAEEPPTLRRLITKPLARSETDQQA